MNSVRASARLLDRRQWFLLYMLGAAAFFEGYDLNVVAVALPQLRGSFHLTQAQASLWISLLFLGALPAVFLSRLADRRGRRLMLLVSIFGYTVATAFTALAGSMAQFVACQFAARMFLSTESAVAWTMVAEELPARSRGFGFGWLSMMVAVGTGTSALIFGAILAPHHLSWRWLYALALPPLVGVFLLRRRLPESRRFTRARAAGLLSDDWRRILHPPHRRWLVLLCLVSVLAALTTHAATFAVDFMETQRHVSPTAASFLIVGAGAPAIIVLITAGALSDRYGRKLIGCSFGLLAVAGALDFFFVARSLPALFVAMAITFTGTFGAGPALGAFGSELFPTSLRALGGSSVALARVLGQALSLAVGGFLLHQFGNLPDTVAVLMLGPVAMIVIVAIWFPETHGRELEEITGETGGGGPVVGPAAVVGPASVLGPAATGPVAAAAEGRARPDRRRRPTGQPLRGWATLRHRAAAPSPPSRRTPHPLGDRIDLLDLLDLDRVGDNSFTAATPGAGRMRLFGGQVASQSLRAAALTVDGSRPPHSFHAYFIRPGTVNTTLHLDVERTRDGRSFTTRQVTASQNGKPIFILAASFHGRRGRGRLAAAGPGRRRRPRDPATPGHGGPLPVVDPVRHPPGRHRPRRLPGVTPAVGAQRRADARRPRAAPVHPGVHLRHRRGPQRPGAGGRRLDVPLHRGQPRPRRLVPPAGAHRRMDPLLDPPGVELRVPRPVRGSHAHP